MKAKIENDVETIRRIAAVPSILDVVSKITGMGFVTVARVTEDRWMACEVLDAIDFGLKPGGELRVETTICSEVRGAREAVVIDNVAEDPVYCGHPTPAMYGFQSYISMPITLADGSFFGTLCAIDPRPARLKTPEVVEMFRLFAELIAVHIDARKRVISAEADLAASLGELAASENALLDARAAEKLREQFIAVLGHDLRNPLGALSSGVHLLLRKPQDDQSRKILNLMAASARRMADLVENMMDFARGRLGGGITLASESKSLAVTFGNVVDEMKAIWPDRDIVTRFDLPRPFDGDHARLAQLLSNLLGNAVTHGAEDRPIVVTARQDDGGLELVVANAGKAIAPDAMARLFQPFYRGAAGPNLQGLGLGLFIAAEIAKAHGGRLEVTSDDDETRFSLRVPSRG